MLIKCKTISQPFKICNSWNEVYRIQKIFLFSYWQMEIWKKYGGNFPHWCEWMANAIKCFHIKYLKTTHKFSLENMHEWWRQLSSTASLDWKSIKKNLSLKEHINSKLNGNIQYLWKQSLWAGPWSCGFQALQKWLLSFSSYVGSRLCFWGTWNVNFPFSSAKVWSKKAEKCSPGHVSY